MKAFVRSFSVEGSPEFEKRRKAAEDQYFARMEQSNLKKLAEEIHKRELREVTEILGPEHELDPETLHRLLEWKHRAH